MDNILKKEQSRIYLNKKATLGSILYQVARHEKSMDWNKLFLSKKQIKQLCVALEIMNQTIDLLEGSDDLDEQDLMKIWEYIENSTYLRNACRTDILEKKRNVILVECSAQTYEYINRLIKKIISDIKMIILKKPLGYKKVIAELLKGLHNLPRVYISNEETIFYTEKLYIEEKDAIEYSGYYLKKFGYKF